MSFPKNANRDRREVGARLRRLADFGPLIDGSLVVVVRRRCGNPTCRCARGAKHPAHYLTRKVGRKTHSLYIPVDLVEDVRRWNQEHRQSSGGNRGDFLRYFGSSGSSPKSASGRARSSPP